MCPTEIIAFSDRAKEFEALNCQVGVAASSMLWSGLAWLASALGCTFGRARSLHAGGSSPRTAQPFCSRLQHLPVRSLPRTGTTGLDVGGCLCLLPQLLACSTDTPEVHLAWIKTPRKRGGLGYMQARPGAPPEQRRFRSVSPGCCKAGPGGVVQPSALIRVAAINTL